MSYRYTSKIPEYVYFVGGEPFSPNDHNSVAGPYVHPQRGGANRKFKIIEVLMDQPKTKKKKDETKRNEGIF